MYRVLSFNVVDSKNVKLADLKTFKDITITVATVYSVACIICLSFEFLCSDTLLPNVKMNRLLQEVMRRASGMWSVCWLCWTSLLFLGSTRGLMGYWKEDGISTSTLNTFRKKLLCRCLVLVFTTVRFQSAMLGKCFSFS